jgi:NhaP-type Na+/H+ or K+/H+ antiporter
MIICWMSTLMFVLAVQAQEEDYTYGEPEDAVLFPWFVQILGVVVFFILARAKWIGMLPFTAVMFLLGMAMGMGAAMLDNSDRLTTSILQWSTINSQLIFLVFLPGLLFKDSFGLNVHLFMVSFWQIINLAFPMVLAGTCLTALVAFYIFPYGWSWNLAMTFGAILSATDPVAVFVMLDDVGAPPRLKMHIGGESVLNDGSSYVFYTIFSLLFFLELGVEGLGSEVDLGEGVAIFFRMSLGGMAFGIAFGLGLTLLLDMLNRKLRGEENVAQVIATITVAYLTYYVADIGETSGIIATLFCGVTARAFGNSMINDQKLMAAFWEHVESLLNTLLFTLAGVVWGTIISNERDKFNMKDWGYLIMLYVLLNAIRFFLVACWYPLISRIGLKSDWQEAVFTSYA